MLQKKVAIFAYYCAFVASVPGSMEKHALSLPDRPLSAPLTLKKAGYATEPFDIAVRPMMMTS